MKKQAFLFIVTIEDGDDSTFRVFVAEQGTVEKTINRLFEIELGDDNWGYTIDQLGVVDGDILFYLAREIGELTDEHINVTAGPLESFIASLDHNSGEEGLKIVESMMNQIRGGRQ